MVTRRQMLRSVGGAALGLGAGMIGGSRLAVFAAETAILPFENGEREFVKYPGKRPLLRLSARPPQLETPFSVFNEGIVTPNDAFFVRYHLAGIPTEIDPDTFRVEIKGKVNTPLSLSLADLKRNYPAQEVMAVHQCSGNSRGLFTPRVAGGQAGNGMMGNALWKGVPLKAVLEKAGVQDGAVQVSFNGMDGPVMDKTPDFAKALDIDHAMDGEVMLAYSMNGEDLPWLNGYPLRLVVPGHYGTYWIKHLNEIEVLDKPFQSFWMDKAYRIPTNACACVEPGAKVMNSTPISRFDVRSFITNVADGGAVQAGDAVKLRGIAFDGGYGVTEVDVSADGGMSWHASTLGQDMGRYSFREWTIAMPIAKGDQVLMVRATNRIGQSQPMEALWNPSGYMRNVVETIHVNAA